MKKFSFLLIFFLAISDFAFAQNTFNERIFNEMMLRFQKDIAKFLKTETSPDFLFVGSDGKVMNYSEFSSFVQGGTFETNEFSNVKIRQFGNTAIVTGLWKHSHILKFNNNLVSYKELTTETFVNQNGKWLFVSHNSVIPSSTTAEDEATIKNVIETESHEFHFNPDRKFLTKFWNINDGSVMMYSGKSGLSLISGKDLKTAVDNGQIPKQDNQATTFSNYFIRVGTNVAWATFDQAGSDKVVTHEFRCLEKIGNDWKVVSSAIQDTH